MAWNENGTAAGNKDHVIYAMNGKLVVQQPNTNIVDQGSRCLFRITAEGKLLSNCNRIASIHLTLLTAVEPRAIAVDEVSMVGAAKKGIALSTTIAVVRRDYWL